MGGNKISQGSQYGRGLTSSTTTRYIFSENRAQLAYLCNEEGFISLDYVSLICEMVEPYTSRSVEVACVEAIITKYDRENHKKGYEGQIEWSYLGEKLQRAKGPAQSSDQINSQVSVAEAPKKIHEE